MIKKLKILGLALIAVAAFSAMAAQMAQAAEGEFSAAKFPVTVTGEQVKGKVTGVETETHTFSTKAGTMACGVAKFDATATKSSHELTVTPTYEKCTLAGLAATIDFTTSGCDYVFTDEKAGAVKVDVVCTVSGGSIRIGVTGSKCQLTILPQTLGGITAVNSGTVPMDITATLDVTGIKYEVHEGTKCPNKPESTVLFTDGTYKGVATFKGEEPGTTTPIDITVT